MKQVALSLDQLSSAVAKAIANIPGIGSVAVGEISACRAQWNTELHDDSMADCTEDFPANTESTTDGFSATTESTSSQPPSTSQTPELTLDEDSLPNPDCEYGWCGSSCGVAARDVAWDGQAFQRRPAEYEAAALANPIRWRDVCEGQELMSLTPNSYDCEARGVVVAPVEVDGRNQTFFEFKGNCPRSDQDRCIGMAFSCAGPSMTTETLIAVKGGGISFSFRAQAGGDYYESLVVVLQCINDACASDEDFVLEDVANFERGNAMTEYVDVSYTFLSSGSKRFRFHLGSYDYTGGTVLGALMFVRPFAYCPR